MFVYLIIIGGHCIYYFIFVEILSNIWGRVNNSIIFTWPQLQMAFSLTELGPRKKNISSWFPFLYKISIPYIPSWTILIPYISNHSFYLLFSKGLFWFHTCTIIIKIFCPDLWVYISIIKDFAIMNEMHEEFFVQNKKYYCSMSSTIRTFMCAYFK